MPIYVANAFVAFVRKLQLEMILPHNFKFPKKVFILELPFLITRHYKKLWSFKIIKFANQNLWRISQLKLYQVGRRKGMFQIFPLKYDLYFNFLLFVYNKPVLEKEQTTECVVKMLRKSISQWKCSPKIVQTSGAEVGN